VTGSDHGLRLAPLDVFVDRMRSDNDRGREIPRFSGHDGVGTRCLFLFETPNCVAVKRGHAERENHDLSARNVEEASDLAGLNRKLTVS
jgi:hypothetical protein